MSVRLAEPLERLRPAFLALKGARDVAQLLDVPYPALIYHVHRAPNRYATFCIRKRGGGYREIATPVTALKLIQQKLHQVLQAACEPRQHAHGFITGRSIRSNANPHVGRRFVLNVDLESFFPSIHFGRVRGVFMAKPFGLPAEVATVLAQICCHQGALPQGAPTSPVVSNLVCRRLDSDLARLARRHGSVYTRYADDLTFSSDAGRFPRQLARVGSDDKHVEIGEGLQQALEENDFRINQAKVHLRDRRRGRQQVTGLVVNERLNVKRSFLRQIRAMLRAWERFGLEQAEREHDRKYATGHRHPGKGRRDFRQVVRGKIEFVGLVRGREDRLYCDLLRKYANLAPDARIVVPTPVPDDPLVRMLDSALFVLEGEQDNPDEDATIKQGTAFLLHEVGVVTCAHVLVGDCTQAFRPRVPYRRYPVRIIVVDESRDLAVLELPPEATEGMRPLARVAGGRFNTRMSIHAAGFPNYRFGDQLALKPGNVVQVRRWGPEQRFSVSAPIVRGMSGGPVLNGDAVMGLAVTGGDSDGALDNAEHGVIPIDAIHRVGQPA